MKKLIACGLVAGMLLCGCGAKPEETTVPTTVPVTTAAPTTEPTTVPTTVPPTTQAPVLRNPLNGEIVEQQSNARPVAVMLNNHTAALPQCGVSKADIIYEILAEGNITRFMAIFSDARDAGPVGPVRSLRAYYLDIMRGYDAICTSAGGSSEADQMVSDLGYERINGIGGAGVQYFYRDDWRRNNRGYEHSLFVKGENLYRGAEEAGFRMELEDGDTIGLHFDEETPFGGEEIEKITVNFLSNSKISELTYDSAKNGYTLFQQGRDFVDGNNDEEVVFRNVLVLHCEHSVLDDVGHRRFVTTGEGEGLYFRDGLHQPITWKRADENAPFEYFLQDGTPVPMGAGKTYVAVIAPDETVEMQ